MLVNLVDLFNFGRECERNKFNYKVGDFRKIDFLGRPWGCGVRLKNIGNTETLVFLSQP